MIIGGRNKKEPTSAALTDRVGCWQKQKRSGHSISSSIIPEKRQYVKSHFEFVKKERIRKMLELLKRMLSDIEGAVLYSELQDLAYTDHHLNLCKQRRILRKAVRRMERLQKADT